MKIPSPLKKYRWLIIIVLLFAGWLTTEFISHRRLVPTGRASTLREFLIWQPSTNRFAAFDHQGKPHVIAFGPMSGWLPSGPSAYVFNDAGLLVDWSADIGDDSSFDTRWNAQRAMISGRVLARDEVDRLAVTRPAQ